MTRQLVAVAVGVAVIAGAGRLATADVTPAVAGLQADTGPRPTISLSAPPTAPSPVPSAALAASATRGPGSSAPTSPKGPPPFLPPVRVGFFGDSQGQTLLAARPAGLSKYLSLSDDTVQGCGVVLGKMRSSSGSVKDFDADCGNWQQKWTTNIARDRPQIAVVEIGSWEVFNLTVNGTKLTFGTSDWDAYVSKQLATGIAILTKANAQVALLSVPCYQPTNGWVERGDRSRTSHVNELLAAAARADPTRVFVIQSASRFCTDPTVAGNTDYRWDGTHFAGAGAALQFQAIAPQLLVIPQRPSEGG